MVIGQYKIIDKIGEGGMGVVFRAEHIVIGQIVAIKSISEDLSSDQEMLQRFIREARIQAKLSHPNVVSLHNFFEYGGKYYLIMEYVDGETLEAKIKSPRPFSLKQCLSIFTQILNGVGYTHDHGIVHRDIKPSNIIIDKFGFVKITDFGIAKQHTDLRITKTGYKIGTLWYMPPEYIKGLPLGPQSDIYSLGILLYQMITGEVPFTGDTHSQVIKAILEANPLPPKEFYPHIPWPLERAILKAISKEPVDRFQTTKEFTNELKALKGYNENRLLTDVPYDLQTDSTKKSLIISSKNWLSQRRVLWPIIGLLFLFGFGAGYLHFFGNPFNRLTSSITVSNTQEFPARLFPHPTPQPLPAFGPPDSPLGAHALKNINLPDFSGDYSLKSAKGTPGKGPSNTFKKSKYQKEDSRIKNNRFNRLGKKTDSAIREEALISVDNKSKDPPLIIPLPSPKNEIEVPSPIKEDHSVPKINAGSWGKKGIKE